VPESRDPQAKSLDIAAIVTFSLALGLLIWALNEGNDDGWNSAGILARLIAASVLFAVFVMAERREPRPMVAFELFRRRTFTGAVLAMIGYGASAQVMVFFLPLYLENAYGYEPLAAGIAMLPFAMPMVLAPRFTSSLASRFSGRALLVAGLATTAIGNLLFWGIARSQLPYETFVVGMLVAGSGAGLLNGQTVKVLGAAVPAERAGMASGLASTTRFIGILVSVAGMGAVLSSVARHTFVTAATSAGLGEHASTEAAKFVTSGNLIGMLRSVPVELRSELRAAGLGSFASGFAAASLLAAVVAVAACLLALWLVGANETRPSRAPQKPPCKLVDCRHPL
jgi:Na+/melibiose symporter-like transporter